jgi:SAM-dependent methyltransferase
MRDIRSFLALPWLYQAFQAGVGARNFRLAVINQYVRPKPGDRVLDIGCGTADIRGDLGDVKYVGFDPSPRYIEKAKSRFPDSTFHVGSVENPPALGNSFEIALAIGVLHHVDDGQAAQLYRLAEGHLQAGGKLVTVDPVKALDGGRIANFIVNQDRGQFVRSEAEYLAIAKNQFSGIVTGTRRSNLLRLPYSHYVMTAVASA